MEYVLTHGSITAVVNSTGAELISLKDATGKEYIWQGDPNYWSGRNPHLFPIVGNLTDDTISFDGVPYHMSRHGFARRSEFSVIEKSKDSIVFHLQQSESTLQAYPFSFALNICHKLTDNGCSTSFEVYNSGSTTLPFCVGGHTAFQCPMNKRDQFTDYHLQFEFDEDAWALFPNSKGLLNPCNKIYSLHQTNILPLNHQIFAEKDTLIFEGLKSSAVSLLGPDGHGVRMDFADFPMIAFWTVGAKQAPYICLEPWHGCAAFEGESGEFTDKHNCILLPPGKQKELAYHVTII